MLLVSDVLAGADVAPSAPLLRASTPRSIGHGAHEMVEVRSLAEQLICEANPMLHGTGRELTLDDEAGGEQLVFTLRSGPTWARVVTSFEQRRSWGQLVTPDSVGAPKELLGVDALPGLILALIMASGEQPAVSMCPRLQGPGAQAGQS